MRPAVVALALLAAAPALAQRDLATVQKEEGDSRLRAGDSTAARAAYERAMAIDPTFLPAYDAAAPLWFAARDFAAAIARLEPAVRTTPAYAMGWYNLAFAYRKTGAHAKAVGAYRAFMKLRPREPDPWFGLGMTYKAMGDAAKAREAFATYVRLEQRPEKKKFVDQARAELAAPAAAAPSDANGWNELGARQFQDGQVEPAIASFEKAVALDARHEVAWYNLAHARRKAGRHPQAIEAYRAFIALDPENPDPYYGLGQSLRAVGDGAGAREAFTRYIALEKRESEKKWVDRARQALGELDRKPAPGPVTPAEIEARYKAGLALEEQGHLRAAITAYERTLLLEPRHARARRRIELARAELARRKKIPPPDRPASLERARTLVANGRGSTALAVLAPLFAAPAAEADADLHAVRAQARVSTGDPAGAIQDWTIVLGLDPRRPDAWRGLGDAWLAAGDKPRARWFYEGFLARAPDDAAAGAIRKRVETP